MAIKGAFVPHLADMLNSPAYGALSLAARKVLDRLEIEHMGKAGKKNGRLVCTHLDFRKFGIHHHGIGPAIREAEALGFLSVRRGVAGRGAYKQSSVYTLTYLPTYQPSEVQPTHDWRQIESPGEARVKARTARKMTPPAQPRNSKRQCRKLAVGPVPETGTGNASAGNRHIYLDNLSRGESPVGAEVVALRPQGGARG